MKKDNETPKDKLKRIQFENEEKKKQLTEEHGAFFGSMSNENNLPPEIESQFLDNIMAFENAFQSATRIQLYDFLGKPSFRKIEELSDAEVPKELERIMNLMSDNQVSLDTICEVDDSELYRFITEELFLEEKDDIHIPGMISHFTYEEFHPNHEHDIRNHSTEFIGSYLDKESDFYTTFMSGDAEKADWHLQFRQAFSSFKLNNFTIKELEFDTEKADVKFDCDFVAKVEDSGEFLHFSGAGEMKLVSQWDFWCIDKIKFPKGQFVNKNR